MDSRRLEEISNTVDFRLHGDIYIPEIEQKIFNHMLKGGKKIRPVLCVLFGRLKEIPPELTVRLARAGEFVHAATLLHDDVVDEAPVRRGRPSFPGRVGNARSVLAGDLLLSRVMVELSDIGTLSLISSLANVIEDLVRGEWLQLELRGSVDVARTSLEHIAKLKTGRLMGWVCEAPNLLAPKSTANKAEYATDYSEACRQFGEHFGQSFQLIDDVLDFSMDGEKPYAHDLTEGLVNSVVADFLENRPDQKDKIKKALYHPNPKEIIPQSLMQDSMGRARLRGQMMIDRAISTLETKIQPQVHQSQGAQESYQELLSMVENLKERTK